MGGTHGTTLPPRLPSSLEPVDEPIGLRSKPAARQRGEVQLYAAGSFDLHGHHVRNRANRKEARGGPAPRRPQRPPRASRIQPVRPPMEEGRWPVKRTVGDVVAV